MTGYLFLGGPVHGEVRPLDGRPVRCEVAVCPPMPVVSYAAIDELVLCEPLEITRFVYEPRLYAPLSQTGLTITIYVPAHMSEAMQWEMVKVLGLGEVPEG